MSKLVKIALEPRLYYFMKKKSEGKPIKLTDRISCPIINNKRHLTRYFGATEAKYESLPFILRSASAQNKYATVRYIRTMYAVEFIVQVRVYVRAGLKADTAIKDFIRIYEIPEDAYPLDFARRYWQGNRKRPEYAVI